MAHSWGYRFKKKPGVRQKPTPGFLQGYLRISSYGERGRVHPGSEDDGAIVGTDAEIVASIPAQTGNGKSGGVCCNIRRVQTLGEGSVGRSLDREAGLIIGVISPAQDQRS